MAHQHGVTEPDGTGYVSNVVYSCGGLITGEQLVLPYGFSDSGIGMATISQPELLAALQDSKN